VLERARLVPERRFVWTAVTQDDLREHGVAMEEVEGLIDIVRRTAEAEISCVLKEEADGTVRVSLRSLGAVDVRRIAEAEGGGGHRFAAGFSSSDTIEQVVTRVQQALPNTG
jgi:bifunctional oligoribonuclease and PAP phosphatase NrnA